MPSAGSDPAGLEKAWKEAFAEYSREVKRTLELLNFTGRPSAHHIDAIEQQRLAERKAFEEYRKARRAYLDLIRGASGLAITLAMGLV